MLISEDENGWYTYMNEKRKPYKFPVATFTLLAINVIVFILCTFKGEMLYNIGCTGYYLIDSPKDYYRLVSAIFLHVDIEHIINNMIFLFCVGQIVENASSGVFLTFSFFATGIIGNVVSLYWEEYSMNYSASVGASGAVFGIMGVFVAFVFSKRVMGKTVSPKRVILSVLCSLYVGFRSAGINNAAHVGGLVSGLIIGMIYCAFVKHKKGKNGNEGYII